MVKDTSEARINDKRESILAAALAVFAEHGVHGTPVPPIAKQAGVSVGSLYRYFDNKEALVNALFQETKQSLAKHLMDGLNLHSLDRSLFDDFWFRLCSFARTYPDAFRFLEMQDHYSYLDDASLRREEEVLLPLRQALTLGQQIGVLNSHLRPEVAMAIFWGSFVGLFKAERLGYLTLSEQDLQQAADACWTALTSK